jgi:hypothetical protein
MTNKQQQRIKQQATARKRRQRAADKARFGNRKIEIVLSDNELELLDQNCITRNQGGEPYSRNEYISLLILCDAVRLAKRIVKLGCCKNCGLPLPVGCGGSFKGEASCFLTRDFRKLNLTSVSCNVDADSMTINSVTCHANLEGEHDEQD